MTTYRPLRGLLKEACPNHVYPIKHKHKHKDCDMMKNFMISGSFTRGMELDEVLDES
jgi:predicted ATP-dependent Lon-type protease